MITTAGLSLLGEVSPAEAAQEYSRRGFAVVILHHLVGAGVCSCSRGTDCGKSAAKHPRLKDWQKIGHAEPARVARWWEKYPGSNVGLAMGGQARLVALDVDGAAGRASLALLEAKYSALPRTLTSRSGREDGGEHRLFVVPPSLDLAAIKNRASKLAPGLDVRAEGGQIVVSPSIHLSGRPYTWIDESPIAELPRWLFDLAAPPPEPLPPPPPRAPSSGGSVDALDRASSYLATMDPAISGSGGHQALWRAAVAMVRGFDLAAGAALALLEREYNPRCQPPWSKRELQHKVENAARAQLPRGYLLEDPRRAWQPERAPRAPRHDEAPHHHQVDDEAPPEPAKPIDPKIAPLLAQLGEAWADTEGRLDPAFLARASELAGDVLEHLGEEQRGAALEAGSAKVQRLIEACAAGRLEAAPELLRALEGVKKAMGIREERRIVPAAEHVLARIGRRKIHVATGLASWDAATRGGLLAGALHTLAAGPDAGKTALALQVATSAAASGTAVVWLAYDEAREDLENRLGQAHGLALEDLESGREDTLVELAAVMRTRPELVLLDGGAEQLLVEDALEVLLAHQRRLGAESALLVVDSIQTARSRALIGPYAPRSQVERLDAVVGALRDASRRGPCVLATSETARGTHARQGKERTAAIAAGKGTSSIEFWSLTQWRLSRIAKGEHAGDIALEPAKNKRGAVDWRGVSIRLERDPDRLTYADCGPVDGADDAPPPKASGDGKPAQPQMSAELLERVRAELRKHPRGVAGGVEGLAGLVRGHRPTIRKAINALDTAGEIERVGTRLFHRDNKPAKTAAPTAEELRGAILTWLRGEAEATRLVPSVTAVVKGLRDGGRPVRRPEVADAIEVLVHAGEIDRNEAGHLAVPT